MTTIAELTARVLQKLNASPLHKVSALMLVNGAESQWGSSILHLESRDGIPLHGMWYPHGMETGKGIGVKNAAQRKRDERERMRAQGYVLRQFWVHPDDWQRVQRYLKRLVSREKHE